MRSITVQRQGTVVGVRAGTFRVTLHGEEVNSFPLELVQELLVYGGVTVTTPALRALLEQGASLHLLTRAGRHLGTLAPGLRGQTELLRAQVQADQPQRNLEQSRLVVRAKLRGCAAVLRRLQQRAPHPAYLRAIQVQTEVLERLDRDTLDTLRGWEGHAAQAYFQAWTETLPVQWAFSGRTRRPPRDPVNALLSLGYAALLNHVLTDIHRVGLHAGFGFFHVQHGQRPALALDLMELHRAPLIERAVLACVNRRLLDPRHFEARGGGVELTPEGRLIFFKELARRLDAQLRPDMTLTYRAAITRSVRRYANALRGGHLYEPDQVR